MKYSCNRCLIAFSVDEVASLESSSSSATSRNQPTSLLEICSLKAVIAIFSRHAPAADQGGKSGDWWAAVLI